MLRLLALKHRPLAKGLILIASEISQLDPYVDLAALPSSRQSEILATWPGPITWLLPSRPTTPLWLRGQHATLAVRVTDHPLAAGLCRQCHSALVSTSANRTGHAPARTALQVRRQFGDRLDFILCGALGQKTSPTEIRDGLTGAVIRQA